MTTTDPPTKHRITTHLQTREGEKDSGLMWILAMEATWPVLLLNQSIFLDIVVLMHLTNHYTSDLIPGISVKIAFLISILLLANVLEPLICIQNRST